MRALLVAALAVVGCHDKPAARPAGPVAGSQAAQDAAPAEAVADPWDKPAAPKPPDGPEARQRRADAALARVATIGPAVAKLRGLAFLHEVPTRYQQAAEFQAFVHREVTRELPEGRSRELGIALAQLGLMTKPLDLAQVEEQAMITQAGAYYDPAAKAFFLVIAPDSELMLDTISAHELTHALQDQHFDLTRYLPSDQSLDDDAATARKFVVEGDATFVMLLYALRGVIGDAISPKLLGLLHQQIDLMANQDVESLKAQARGQAAALSGMGAELKQSIDAMDDIPATVLVPLLDSYMKGARVALAAYEHGGWSGVDALYRDPPSSTEQVLHPATKLYPVRERPHKVTLLATADHELAGSVLGELQWKIYFDLWKTPHAAEAAEGWGGDRYAVTRRKDGRLIVRIATTWDTAEDAAQFTTAYLASLAARFPGVSTAQAAAGIARPGGGKLFVRSAGARVYILDGADDASALDAMVRSTRID